jgi:putative transposase
MARQACPQQPGVALHLVQRGRGACFFGEDDRLDYLQRLRAAALGLECPVHAYVLMGNHVHLLVTPARADGGSELLRRLDASAAELDATPVVAPRYLLACMRYIELNPVRAGLVKSAADFRWSSYRANVLGKVDALVTPHPCYYALGRTPHARRAAYLAVSSGAPPAAAGARRGWRASSPRTPG